VVPQVASGEFLTVVGQATSGASVTIKNEAFEGGGGGVSSIFGPGTEGGGCLSARDKNKTICRQDN
jgi:hypothetical protein